MHIWVEKRYFISNSLVWISGLMICTFSYDLLYANMIVTVYTYLIANLVLGIISSDVAFSLPVLVIRITGFIRYLLMAIVMNMNNTSVVLSNQWIMIIEIIGQYTAIIFFDIWRKTILVKKRTLENTKEGNISDIKNNVDINKKWGVVLISVISIASLYIFSHREILVAYFTFSSQKPEVTYINGLIGLLIKAFFLIIYIKCIDFIQSIHFIGDFLKICMIIILSIFYINGAAISSSDVSRWTIVIMSYIAYVFICKYHAKYKKVLLFILVIGLTIAILGSTMIKFGSIGGNTAYSTSGSALKNLSSFETLNAYFSGPSNSETGIKVSDYVTSKGISRFQLLISDIFRNFPLLNKYLSSTEISSVRIFNQLHYGSSIAMDQIIPFACQSYTFFGAFFFAPEMVLIWIALRAYYAMKTESNLMKIYYFAYIAFFFALINCINITIIFQTLWISILPIYLINWFNERLKVK